MKTWNPDASEHFEAWLGRVRLSVAGDPAVDVDDVAQDLRAHVHAELEATPEPVTVGALERVLDSLGNPTQWTDTTKAAAPTRPTVKFHRTVEDTFTEWQRKLAGDWGKPVLLTVLTLIAIPTFDWIGAPLLLFTYFVARSHVTYAPQELAGRKRWLVYFPLAIGAGLLTGLVLAFPVLLRGQYAPLLEAIWALGLWWILVGVLAAREPKRVRAALLPFAEGFDASHGRMLSLIGIAFLMLATVLMVAR